MFDFGTTTTFDREILLSFFLNYMGQEQRGKLMREYPLLYNRLCEREIMRVENTTRSDYSGREGN